MTRKLSTLAALLCALSIFCGGCASGTHGTHSKPPSHRLGLDSGEVVLASNPDQPGTTKSNAYVNPSNSAAETFRFANVPPEATSVRVTSAVLNMSKADAVGTQPWKVELRRLAADGKVSGGTTPAVIESVTIPAASLPIGTSPSPYTVTFTGAGNLNPTEPIAICVIPPPFAPKGFIGCQDGGTQTPADMSFSLGMGWPPNWMAQQSTGKDFILEVRGTYTTP